MKHKCAFCDKQATKSSCTILGTNPKDPQGYRDFKRIGDDIYTCEDHSLEYNSMEIEEYFRAIKK